MSMENPMHAVETPVVSDNQNLIEEETSFNGRNYKNQPLKRFGVFVIFFLIFVASIFLHNIKNFDDFPSKNNATNTTNATNF